MQHAAEKEVYGNPERLIIVACKTQDEPPQPVESLLSTEEELYRNGRLRHAQYGGKRVKVKATTFPRVVTDDSSVSKKTRND